MPEYFTHVLVNLSPSAVLLSCDQPFAVVEVLPQYFKADVFVSGVNYTSDSFDTRSWVVGGYLRISAHRELLPGGLFVELFCLANPGYDSFIDVASVGAVVVITASAARPNYSFQ